MNKSRKIALIFIWHNKPLASWVMYPVPTLNIKHCFRFLSYTILIGNGENESRMKDTTNKTSCFLLSNPFILTLIVLAIWAYEPHAFSVSEIWTVRGTGAESWKRSKDSKRKMIVSIIITKNRFLFVLRSKKQFSLVLTMNFLSFLLLYQDNENL